MGGTNINPRKYQVELFEAAKQRNVSDEYAFSFSMTVQLTLAAAAEFVHSAIHMPMTAGYL